MIGGEEGIDNRQHEQGEQRADGKSGDDGDADGLAARCAPAPEAITSGMMPMMVEKEVIRISAAGVWKRP